MKEAVIVKIRNRTLCIMDQQVITNCKHKLINVCLVKAKACKYGLFFISFIIKNELLVIDPKPSDLIRGRPSRAEPVYVAKY